MCGRGTYSVLGGALQTTGVWPPSSPLSPLQTSHSPSTRRVDPEFRSPMQSAMEEDVDTVVGNFQNDKSSTVPRMTETRLRKIVAGLQDFEGESQIENTGRYMPRYKDKFNPKSAVEGDASQRNSPLIISPHLPPTPDAQR